MVFPKKSRWNKFLLVLLGKMIFFSPENMILPLRRKMKDDLSQKNTRKHDIFFKRSERMVFSKRAALGHDLSCIIWEDGIFSQNHIFSLGGKWEMIFLKKYIEIWYISVYTYRCYKRGATPLCQKKSKMVLSHKNTRKGDWRLRLTF